LVGIVSAGDLSGLKDAESEIAPEADNRFADQQATDNPKSAGDRIQLA
jgi:hypothetical protein